MGHPAFVAGDGTGGMTKGVEGDAFSFAVLTQGVTRLPALNPDFLYAALDATAYAAFVKESRKKRAGATKLHRKSGEVRSQSRGSFTER
jgi:hypothetical protein